MVVEKLSNKRGAKHQQNSGSNDEHALSLDEWSPVKDPAHVRNASALTNARVSTKTRSLHHFRRPGLVPSRSRPRVHKDTLAPPLHAVLALALALLLVLCSLAQRTCDAIGGCNKGAGAAGAAHAHAWRGWRRSWHRFDSPADAGRPAWHTAVKRRID